MKLSSAITVAGQWRIYTALPVHRNPVHYLWRYFTDEKDLKQIYLEIRLIRVIRGLINYSQTTIYSPSLNPASMKKRGAG